MSHEAGCVSRTGGGNKSAQAQTITNQRFRRWGVVGPWLTSSRSEAVVVHGLCNGWDMYMEEVEAVTIAN